MIANLKPEDRDRYDADFQAFLEKIVTVAKFTPRHKYLYPVMDGVPFKDLNVALDLAVMQRAKKKANDNP